MTTSDSHDSQAESTAVKMNKRQKINEAERAKQEKLNIEFNNARAVLDSEIRRGSKRTNMEEDT
jgi:endo-alpha-1,4-polygalactosaminidase (GH114 family)